MDFLEVLVKDLDWERLTKENSYFFALYITEFYVQFHLKKDFWGIFLKVQKPLL